MFQELLKKIEPLFDEDRDEFNEIRRVIGNSKFQIVWDASSGLDFYPLVALLSGKFPESITSQMPNSILIMSDYSQNIIKILKSIYDKLSYGSVEVLKKGGEFNYFRGLFQVHINGSVNLHIPNNIKVFVDQMIPFSLWSSKEIEEFRKKYEFHPSVTDSPVTDKKWHLVYFLLRVVSNRGELYIPILFISAENLLIFNEIFKKYEIPIEAFFAVRVGGKSGSWDMIHDFENGKLPRAIEKAPKHLRPKYWGLDSSIGRPKESFSKVAHIEGMGFYGCGIYETHWR